MTTATDLDHVSFAVSDARAWARRLRRELGATPIFGEALAEFRYLLLYIGNARRGARIELLEPAGPGFLDRFLAKHGESPHHITFAVADLADAVRRVRLLGLTVVGENYDHDPWREAFIAPDGAHGTVIQLAQSDRSYPSPAQLLRSTERDLATFPTSAGATDQTWWTSVWDTEPQHFGILGPAHLHTTDPDLSRRLFCDVLGAQVAEDDTALRVSWPSGSLLVTAADEPGVVGMSLEGGPAEGMRIGPAELGVGARPRRTAFEPDLDSGRSSP